MRVFLALVLFCSSTLLMSKSYTEDWHTVPFANLDRANETRLEYKPKALSFRLKAKDYTVTLNDGYIPLKVIQHNGRSFIFQRKLFDGANKISIYEKKKYIRDIAIPAHISKFIFMNAEKADKDIALVFYNPVSMRHFFYRIKLEEGLFDKHWVREANWGEKHISNHSVSVYAYTATDPEYGAKKNAKFVCGNVIYTYRNIIAPSIDRLELENGYEYFACENKEGKQVGFFKKADFNENIPGKINDQIKAVDLETGLESTAGYSFNLDSIEHMLGSFEPSGLLNAGLNNEEGLVPWSQTYYLNAYINLVKKWPHLHPLSKKSLLLDIHERLAFEIYLLDQMVLKYGIHSFRYSVERNPLLCSLHAIRIYRVLRRYKKYSEPPFEVKSIELIERSFSAKERERYFDSITRADTDGSGLLKGECYQAYKRGTPFPHDGLNAPYNYMNALNGEFTFMRFNDEDPYKRFIKDSAVIFLRSEGFYNQYPKDYQWHYSWGKLREGRRAEEKICVNQPAYPPDNSMAHISYRTIDLIGLLTVQRAYPEVFPKGFVEYARDAMKNGGVYPFVYEELEDYKCELNPSVAQYYAIPLAPWELESASIAWLHLFNKNE
ncbi:MAG: hypothetical protein C0514_08385 [Candidatus Puniceispirillum sp.]|nr:hypothetical protein [Candidatus Puniceispirillum sp.]